MDEIQFLQLIDQHQGAIHKICRLYRDSREDREDLFQEIVFQLWKSAPSFGDKAKFSSWMYRVALNTALTVFRRRKPAIVYGALLPDRPEVKEEQNEQEEKLFEALRQLNGADKALIALYLEDLSYKEIAKITGIDENNVGVRIHRIKNKLQQQLKS